MERNNRVATAVRRALIMSALTTAGVAAPALAQDNLGEIVVTGSRIKSANLETTTPVTQITAGDVVTRGVNRIEDMVNQLPQAFAAQNVNVSNGSDGTATVSLRGIGSERTLVLIDGRRMPYGSVNSSAANLNSIPTQMIERVEILTGGASAVYGSDAVAGVVNFIMKKDFEGVEVTSQYNFYWHENDYKGPGAVKLRDTIATRALTNPAQFALPPSTVTDGEGKQIGVIMGVNSGDGRGNITAYANLFDSDEVLQRDRDYSACSLNPNPTVSFTCGGSSTSAGGRFTTFGGPSYPDPDGPGGPLLAGPAYNFTINTPTNFRNFLSATDQYNFGPLNHYQRPERRYNLGANGHYEFGEHADVYTQLAFNDYSSIAQIAPGGNFFNTSSVNCDNPLLPQGSGPGGLASFGCTPSRVAAGDSVTMYIGRRNVEGGGRQQQFSQQGYRGVVGLRGAINEVWDYDVSAQYSSGVGNVVTANYFVEDRIERALDVVSVAGVPTCQSVIDGSDPNCVPWNPFTPGGITQAQLDYLQAQGLQIGALTQEIYNGVIQGDLSGYGMKLPWASDGVQVVFGAEYRSDTLDHDVDALQEAFQLAGSGGPTIGITGQTKVNDLFFEAKVPIAQDQAGFESLSFDTAYRYSDYGSGVQTDTYKLGMEWAPVSDIRFRASYQRAVRAANIVELFTAQGFSLFDLNGDPCGIDAPNANATTAECIASGVPASFYDGVGDLAERGALDSPAGQYNFLAGGNPALAPEESDTQSFGIILTPRFAPGLNMTVDWFNIKVDEAISIFQPSDTLNACYNSNDAAACSRIRRNAIGSLWVGTGNVIATNINIGSLEATGIDVNVGYSEVEIGRFGSLNFSLVGTYFDELIIEPGPGVALYDCVGAYSGACGTPTNEWRHMFRTSWETPWDVDLSVGWRFFSSTTGITDFDPNLPLPANRIDRTAPAESYFDLSANWAVTEKASVILGINNVLDDNPTLSAGTGTTGNGNTYPQTYDALGRYVFMRATLTF